MLDASEMKQGIKVDFRVGEVFGVDGFSGKKIGTFQGIEGINATDFDDLIIGDKVSVRCAPPNGADFDALVSTIDSGHLGALYVGEAKETALVG